MYILDDPLRLYTCFSDNIWHWTDDFIPAVGGKLQTTFLSEEVKEWLYEYDLDWSQEVDENGRIYIQFTNPDAILLFKLTW